MAHTMNKQAEIPLPVKDIVKTCMNDFDSFARIIMKAERPVLSNWEFIADSGTFSRFFRRWYQTTWGTESYCDFFSGTTPRQRLEREIITGHLLDDHRIFISPRIDQNVLSEGKGIAYHYYSLVYSTNRKDNDCCNPSPLFTEFSSLGRLLERGLTSNNKGVLRVSYDHYWPHFHIGDKDFLSWIVKILLKMGLIEFRPSEKRPVIGKLFLNSRGKAYFSLEPQDQFAAFFETFLNLSIANIVEAAISGTTFSKRTATEDSVRIAIKKEITEVFFSATHSSDWICADKFFTDLWTILHRHFPNNLLSPRDFEGYIKNPERLEKREPMKSLFTKFVYYELSLGLDKHFLFPLDRYFGMAECVWTDYKNIFQDMQIYFGLTKKLADKCGYYFTAQDKEDYTRFCDAFFSPCTCFRIHVAY